MAVRAIFRTCELTATSDNPRSAGVSEGIVYESVGMLTANNVYNKGAGLQRIDSVADESFSVAVAALGTITVPLGALVSTVRTLVRVTSKAKFSVSVTPVAGSPVVISVVGSVFMKGIYEATFDNLSALVVTNDEPLLAATFNITVANVVDYDDGQVSNLVP